MLFGRGDVPTKSHVLCSRFLQRPHLARTTAVVGLQCGLVGGASGARGTALVCRALSHLSKKGEEQGAVGC